MFVFKRHILKNDFNFDFFSDNPDLQCLPIVVN